MPFEKFGLRAELLKAIKDKGYTTPTPIQTKAIPVILGGQDIFARAQTGTGKTDAFSLPIVDILSRQKSPGRHPRALVLTPTRELAAQVAESIQSYARRVSLRSAVVYGGVRIDPQINRLRRGIDILVATPGRLLDLAGQRRLNLSLIEFLVFDEADRMLDMGFSEEISEVLDIVPDERRTMLFSATYSPQIRALARRMLLYPEHVETTPKITAAESVFQKVHKVSRSNKRNLLIHLITEGNWDRALVFSRTRHGANALTERLAAKGISVAALHSNKSQSFRTRTLTEFKNGEIHILVATDVAARGLDIAELPYVINYDMPDIPEDYVHRIGRSGRAGKKGVSISLVSPDETPRLLAIEALINQKIPVEAVRGYTVESDVPDFVLFRPDSAASKKKADREIQEIVDKRKSSKQASGNVRAKGAGKKSKIGPKRGSGPKSKPGLPVEDGSKKKSDARSRPPSKAFESSRKVKSNDRKTKRTKTQSKRMGKKKTGPKKTTPKR